VHAGSLHLRQSESEHQQCHQQVENPLQTPGGKLRRDRNRFLPGDQVRTYKFTGTAEKRDRREPDHGGRKDPSD
jgi:hypothetical protein